MIEKYLPLALVLFFLYLCCRGLDRINDAFLALHHDYRKVNNLDQREELEAMIDS